MKRRQKFHFGTVLLRLILIIFIGSFFILTPISAQDDSYAEDDSLYFWDDSEEGEYYEDEYYDDEYYEEDDTTAYDDDEYYDDTYYEDEYYEDEVGDEYYEDDSEYSDDEGYYEFDEESGEYVEERGDADLTDSVLSEQARRMGYSLSISYASPGFVNHALNTYNSYADYRISVELPMLMQMFKSRFRIGFEYGTFAFENYMPSSGDYKGSTIMGLLSFPAGPGQVKLGGGKIGDYYGYFAETSYGLALGNILDIRVGVRATSASGVIDSNENELGTASWLDGLVTLGVNF